LFASFLAWSSHTPWVSLDGTRPIRPPKPYRAPVPGPTLSHAAAGFASLAAVFPPPSAAAEAEASAAAAAAAGSSLGVPQVSGSDVAVFVAGCIPFLWATWEFWRRIAVGETFGTGRDAVVFPKEAIIGEDDNRSSSRGRRTLGAGALLAAYALFTIVGITVVLCGLVVYSAVQTP